MHLCTCEIAVGGDIRNTVVRDKFIPVTFPEINVLKLIHGEAAVTDVEVVDEVDRDPGEEKTRLLIKYPKAAVESLFPGTKPPMETEVPDVKKASKRKPRKKAAVKAAAQPEADEDGVSPFGDKTE